MSWTLEFREEAKDDLKRLAHPQQTLVLKGIRKVLTNPLPNAEGGYGKPLGNHRGVNLTGLMKIKFKDAGLRVVYQIKREGQVMTVIVISVRDDEAVYRLAAKRMGR